MNRRHVLRGMGAACAVAVVGVGGPQLLKHMGDQQELARLQKQAKQRLKFAKKASRLLKRAARRLKPRKRRR